MNVIYTTNKNNCDYNIETNREYLSPNKKEIAEKYLEERHLITADVKELTVGDNNYLTYSEEETKKDYYIYITDKGFTIMTVLYTKDVDNKCHEYTEYILKNLRRLR